MKGYFQAQPPVSGYAFSLHRFGVRVNADVHSVHPYLNYEPVNAAPDDLPEGSALETIAGGSYIVPAESLTAAIFGRS